MSILSLYETKQSAISKFKKAKTYLQRLTNSKGQSALVDQATNVSPMGMSSMVGKDSEYNQEKITKYLG